MNKKLGKRLLYMGLPAIGIMFCLYYLSIATEDVAYTDYMRLIVSYLPDVANPAKFFVPDVLTRVPITYLGRIINVAFFHYSTVFDMVLGVLSHGLAALALASYCRDKKGYAPWFLVIMLLMFSLNKWEMLGNGSGWVCFLSIAGFYWNFVILDRTVSGRERKYDRVLLKALPALLTLLVAGPYCGSYSLVMTMAYCALLVSDYRQNHRINREWAADLAFVLGALGLYLLSNHFAVYEYRGATEATLISTLVSGPKFFVKFVLEAFASPVIGIEVVSNVIKTTSGVCLLGAVVICFYLLALWLNVKYRLWERTILPLMLILIGGVNHALVVYSRWIFLQENYGMASRYAIQYEMGIFGILLTFAAVFALKQKQKKVLAVLAGGFICLLLAGNFYTTREELLKAPLRKLSLEQTIETALDYRNKTDEELGAQLHTNGERARKALEILDENNLNIFYQEGAE
ncbi:MAG: hypothetical protein KH353_03710 [Clostridium sp.]|nr:hypothetical protein [Clostridium sp.]